MPLSNLTQLLSFLEWGENETQTLLQGGRRLRKVESAGAHSIYPPTARPSAEPGTRHRPVLLVLSSLDIPSLWDGRQEECCLNKLA